MKQYYITYNEKADINYTFLFCLYLLAETDKKERIDNTILFNTQKELIEQIKEYCNISFSKSTVSRILNDKNYFPYFSIDYQAKRIILNNNFKKGTSNNKFIILNDKEIYFLL